MSEARRTDSSQGRGLYRGSVRAPRLLMGIGLSILLAVGSIVALNSSRIYTLFKRNIYDFGPLSGAPVKPELPRAREETAVAPKPSLSEPRASIGTGGAGALIRTIPEGVQSSASPPSAESAEPTTGRIVAPPKRLAKIAPIPSIDRILPDLEHRQAEPEPDRKYTVAERLDQYGEKARDRLMSHFKTAGVQYPPAAVTLVGLKKERRLELYAGDTHDDLKFVCQFPIQAASGVTGPKLKQGDKQVPEGLYRLVALNPNSRFHLSIRVNYPNRFDVKMGKRDGRNRLGGDIMIHGNRVSKGCLAMGDEAAEDLFVLAADTGLRRMRLILSPVDFRADDLSKEVGMGKLPKWSNRLYAMIRKQLDRLPNPPVSSALDLDDLLSGMFSRSVE